jgi:hypothetical protein
VGAALIATVGSAFERFGPRGSLLAGRRGDGLGAVG